MSLVVIMRMLILPPTSLFLLLGVGLLLRRRYPAAARLLCGGAVALLFVLSTGVGALALVYPLEHLTHALRASDAMRGKAIVVLAAGRVANAPEYGGVDIPDYVALARLRYAAHLHRETGLPVLVSGGNGSADGVIKSKAQAMAATLRQDFGIPVNWIEGQSATTAENAFFSSKILKEEGISSILLVTDAMHMPRAAMAFDACGMQVISAPTMFFSAGSPGLLDFLPSAEHLRQSYYASYEWIGLGWYALRYRGIGHDEASSLSASG